MVYSWKFEDFPNCDHRTLTSLQNNDRSLTNNEAPELVKLRKSSQGSYIPIYKLYESKPIKGIDHFGFFAFPITAVTYFLPPLPLPPDNSPLKCVHRTNVNTLRLYSNSSFVHCWKSLFNLTRSTFAVSWFANTEHRPRSGMRERGPVESSFGAVHSSHYMPCLM